MQAVRMGGLIRHNILRNVVRTEVLDSPMRRGSTLFSHV